MLAETQDFAASGGLIQEHAAELEFLSDLIQWRLEFQKVEPNEFDRDNPFYWRFSLRGLVCRLSMERAGEGGLRCGRV